jgi:DNA-binding HxlR family transcriptional regulator
MTGRERMEDQKQIEQDKQRAEVFDALGHPTRILILKVLSEGAVGFADLKKKTSIESSGHLQHHLTKLNGLIKTDEYGKYCLSDEGKDALLTVQTVENASPEKQVKVKGHKHFRVGIKPVAFLLVALLLASSAIAVYEYSQAVGLHNENTFFKGANPEATAYYNQFGAIIPITNVNSSFAPPISMYQALLIAFENNGWNKTSLQDNVVSVYLQYWKTVTNVSLAYQEYPKNLSSVLNPTMVTSQPTDYSDVYGNGLIYQYVWAIEIQGGQPNIIDLPISILVDASTGQIIHQ